MNDIINWIATHDTLLIRVGFTAILVLVVVYIYRFFFVPKINIAVEVPAAASSDNTTTTEAAKATAAPPSFDLSVVAKKTEEIENLKQEVTKLKTQVGDSEKVISELKEKAAAVTAQLETAQAENTGTNSDGSAAAGAADADPNLVATLNGQIEQLQNRLAEYEIIAEDISEISQLRQENAELKKKLGASSNPVAAPAVELKAEPVAEFNEPTQNTTTETPPEETPAEAVTVEEAIAEVAAIETVAEKAERVSAESIKLVSEKEVTSTEKELINQFEEVLTKKGS